MQQRSSRHGNVLEHIMVNKSVIKVHFFSSPFQFSEVEPKLYLNKSVVCFLRSFSQSLMAGLLRGALYEALMCCMFVAAWLWVGMSSCLCCRCSGSRTEGLTGPQKPWGRSPVWLTVPLSASDCYLRRTGSACRANRFQTILVIFRRATSTAPAGRSNEPAGQV